MIEKISKYRSALMGVATLMVVAYHYRLNFNIEEIRNIASVGYSGVDIFLFVSGFGLFCGYCKRPDGFLLRRFLRVYPTYLLFLVVLAAFSSRYTIGESLLARTGIGYYLPFCHIKWFDWYIPTMFLLYGLFPLMVKLIAPQAPTFKFQSPHCVCFIRAVRNTFYSYSNRYSERNCYAYRF